MPLRQFIGTQTRGRGDRLRSRAYHRNDDIMKSPLGKMLRQTYRDRQ
jgi:hypothetical protein